jgi:hypothetical protein
MDNFQPSAVISLQNFLHPINIERLIERFIKKKFNQEEHLSIDRKKGTISYYNTILNDLVEIKFETELKELLWELTNNIKSEIDLSNVKLTNKEKVKFWNNIIKSFDYIEETHFSVISTFPICLKPKEDIKEYLEVKYLFNQKSQFDGSSYFTLKERYNWNDLENIFEFITIQGYLDDELFDFDNFVSALFDTETDIKLSFNCKTKVLICFLKELSNLFLDFTAKRISNSARFLTKGSFVITDTNFNATVSRNKKTSDPEITKIRKFFSENYS